MVSFSGMMELLLGLQEKAAKQIPEESQPGAEKSAMYSRRYGDCEHD
jgi:hypothetical protein